MAPELPNESDGFPGQMGKGGGALNTNHCTTMLTVMQEKSYQKAAVILH